MSRLINGRMDSSCMQQDALGITMWFMPWYLPETADLVLDFFTVYVCLFFSAFQKIPGSVPPPSPGSTRGPYPTCSRPPRSSARWTRPAVATPTIATTDNSSWWWSTTPSTWPRPVPPGTTALVSSRPFRRRSCSPRRGSTPWEWTAPDTDSRTSQSCQNTPGRWTSRGIW